MNTFPTHAATPKPPYYAVIFTSLKSEEPEGYNDTSERMLELVHQQEGFLGFESFRNEHGFGVTISYWRSLEEIKKWKQNDPHLWAQEQGKKRWYKSYKVRICKVEHDYSFDSE
jgi:heme-degrading monooxygenase HmoA